MSKNRYKLLSLIIPTMLLTGCGYGLKEIYEGDVYNSVDYNRNFYREWNDEINYKKDGNKVENKDQEVYQLDKVTNKVFTNFNDPNFLLLQSDASEYSYTSDIYEPADKKSYGQTFMLSKTEQSFRYGYISKLFNGQMFCNGSYELARVQIDEDGFGAKFKKEIKEYNYLALNFKASLDYRRDGKSTNIPSHLSSINLIINFYCKTDNGSYHRVPVSYQIDNLQTNTSESIGYTNYIFFGFDLSTIEKIDRCAGISIEYQLINDEYKDSHSEDNWKHCLLLYELFLPGSTWH